VAGPATVPGPTDSAVSNFNYTGLAAARKKKRHYVWKNVHATSMTIRSYERQRGVGERECERELCSEREGETERARETKERLKRKEKERERKVELHTYLIAVHVFWFAWAPRGRDSLLRCFRIIFVSSRSKVSTRQILS
jgi:hypothetical protein